MKIGLPLLLLLIFLKGDLPAQTGINWSPATTVSAPSYYNNHPRITIDRMGDPMVIWGRNTDHALFFSRWTGSGFGMPTQLNPAGMAVATDSWQGPQIASHGDTVYVVFKQFPEAPDSAHIYCTRSFDGGFSFMAPVRVSFIGDSICRFPTVTTDALGNPIVGFMKFDSNFGNARWVVSVSQDFGNSFLPDVLASGWSSPTSTVCDCCPGSITSNGNTVAMLYRDNDNDLRDTWAGLSHDSGQTFTEGMNIDQNNWMISNCPATGPDGFIIGDTLYSVFMNGAGGAAGVYFSTSSISAASGSASWQLNGTTPGLTYQNFPRTANYNNAVAVAWKQVVGSSDQCVIRFTNDIHSGLPSVYDTVDLANITNVDVAVSDSTVFVVWQGNNNGSVNFRRGSYTPFSSGISDIDYKSARIYPNPVTGNTVSIQSNTPFRNPHVAVYNNMGQPVVSTSSVLNDHILDIDISSLQQGFFNLEITDGHTIYRARFIRL